MLSYPEWGMRNALRLRISRFVFGTGMIARVSV